MRLQIHGVNQVDPGEAEVGVAELDGVFPDGFYSSTNLETQVRLDGHWVDGATTPRWTAGWSSTDEGADRTRPHAADGRREGRHAGRLRRRRASR